MTDPRDDDELARLLGAAFDAQARASVPDARQVPPRRDPGDGTGDGIGDRAAGRRRLLARSAPLVAAAVVVLIVALVVATTRSSGHRHSADGGTGVPSAGPSGASVPASTVSSAAGPSTGPSSAASSSAGTPVHIKLLNSDGSTYGVGMPVIAYLSKKITDAGPLQDATTVTVDGKPAKGAWYFEYSSANKRYPIEGHFRLENYWPAHSKIHVGIPSEGLSAGTGMSYDDSVTLDFSTGARNVSVVDDSTHTMTVTSDGKTYGTFPVSLGASATPTRRGTKVIMEKGRSICMSGPGYSECGVKDTQRLTYDGEYLHAAPWNVSHIKSGVDSSNGCTNLTPADAEKLYSFLEVGDVVTYPNADGPAMQFGQGYGDWNVSWPTWQTGGLVPTR